MTRQKITCRDGILTLITFINDFHTSISEDTGVLCLSWSFCLSDIGIRLLYWHKTRLGCIWHQSRHKQHEPSNLGAAPTFITNTCQCQCYVSISSRWKPLVAIEFIAAVNLLHCNRLSATRWQHRQYITMLRHLPTMTTTVNSLLAQLTTTK